MHDISDHGHPMHKGPHHAKYIHAENRMGAEGKHHEALEVHEKRKGEHALGDKSHLKSVMGEPKGADVAGHKGKMHWQESDMKPKKKAPPKKGNAIPDSKPENDYRKGARAAEITRKAAKNEHPKGKR